MSGIAGVVRTDGAPVAPALISGLTEALAFRGPDAQTTWCSGQTALGHTLLRTTFESAGDVQPLTIDHVVWLVADARLDARAELMSKLAASPTPLTAASDAELILHAYLQWGEHCVEHLLGDFAFAIWDGRTRRLVCARDQMGVKPLYYAMVGPWLVISNTLTAIRRHPAVSDRLNDVAIADFLLFACNQDETTTSFRDVRRVPPAHTLVWSANELRTRRYWSIPVDEPVYYRRDQDYIDRFSALLREAVSDRLRTNRVGVLMSGGLDSTLLAATAQRLLGRSSGPPAVRAFTFIPESQAPDSERGYAEAAARHLDVPIHFCELSGRIGPMRQSCNTPEPSSHVEDVSVRLNFYAQIATHGRVVFYGEGPDNALHYEWRPHLSYLVKRRRWRHLAADVAKHMWRHRRIPLLPGVPRLVRRGLAADRAEPTFPSWLEPGLVDRLQLKERWRCVHAPTASCHPTRPVGYASLSSPQWSSLFESFEPGYTGALFEARHPYVDLRLLRFMLSVPALPWCRGKHLVRAATRGCLPESVRLRAKTPVSSVAEREQKRRHGMPPLLPTRALESYADVRRWPDASPQRESTVQSDLRLVALSLWLRRQATVDSQPPGGDQHESRTEGIGSERG